MLILQRKLICLCRESDEADPTQTLRILKKCNVLNNILQIFLQGFRRGKIISRSLIFIYKCADSEYTETQTDACPYCAHMHKVGGIVLLSITCYYAVSTRRGFLFLLVLRTGFVILLWHSLGLPYNYFFL